MAVARPSVAQHASDQLRLDFAGAIDSNRAKASVDTTLPNTPLSASRLWRRPQAQRDGSRLYVTDEALRYYASPVTIPQLLEETGEGLPLLLGEESYERESFLFTSRTSEGIVSSRINGVLPATSILNGTYLSNEYPLDAFSDIAIDHGATGLAMAGADHAPSDILSYTVERFRAPVPYSRVHYAQELGRATSEFDALFSINSTSSTNLAFGLHRHATGHAPAPYDLTFNPRTDLWGLRGQMSVSKYLGTLPRDSTMTPHKIDSILATPAAKGRTFDLLLWTNYTTGFSGASGGVVAQDSNFFDPRVAQVLDQNTFEHRVRIDGLLDIELPLIAEARTRLSGFASYESRRILSRDTSFPAYVPELSIGNRYGATLLQPFTFAIGDFLTRPTAQGDILYVRRDNVLTTGSGVTETRFAGSLSDSSALSTAFRISLFGFVRLVQSNLTVGNGAISSSVYPSIGATGRIGFTDALAFTASYNYAKDRMALSPTPDAEYLLRNISGFLDLRFRTGANDSIALHAGVMDRNEPEGIVYAHADTGTLYVPRFSNENLHTQAAVIGLDAYFSHFHFSSVLNYFPTTEPIAPVTNIVLASSYTQRFFGNAGLYYENEIGEGNLRLSLGARLRFIDRLDPQLTYDRGADYYTFQGLTPLTDTAVHVLNDASLRSPKGMLDVLLATEIDRRAQVNMSFLNILSTPYYNVSFYPRAGFHWKIDVIWAFLD